MFPLIPSLWFSCVFHSFIHPSLLQGVYPILPPSSLFVLIMSMEAHAACPQRESDGEAHRRTKKSKSMRRERTLSFHGRLLVFHFCRNGLFVCPESRFGIPHFWCLVHFFNNACVFPRCTYACMWLNMCKLAFMCLLFTLCGYPTPFLVWQLGGVAMGTTEGQQE